MAQPATDLRSSLTPPAPATPAGGPAAAQAGTAPAEPAAAAAAAPVWRFGRFELRPAERQLLDQGQPAELGARAFDLLVTLAEGGGALLTKQQLLDRVWAGLVVEEANLSVQVSSLRKVLGGDVIATIPGRGYRFSAELTVVHEPRHGSAAAPAPAAAAVAAPTPPSAPAAPPLLGRHDELVQLTAAVALPGCVTLAGPSGVGKTTLARALARADAQGLVWVDLAPLDEQSDVAASLARALGVARPDDLGDLARAVGARLLVLDNAERVAEPTALLLAALCAAQPGLRALVTSQRPLALAVERVHRVEPLALPRDDAQDLGHGAVALLVDRVRAADARMQPGPEALPLLRQIVRRLDGLPLAIEMAAARVPMLGLRGVLDALDSRFALLTAGYRSAPGRHRTLHAALEWSHASLGPEEQRLFRACAVFAGGFTLDLVAAVASDEHHGRWDLIDTLAQLVDRSLVAVTSRDPPRYYLLESLRAYALERLAEAPDEAFALRRRHAQAVRELFDHGLNHSPLEREQAITEHDNAREAAAWASAHDPALAVSLTRLVARLVRFTSWRREAARWLDAVEPQVGHADVTPQSRADWWYEQASQQLMSYDPRAPDSARHACALYEALGDDKGLFNAMSAVIRASSEPSDDLPGLCERMRVLLGLHPEWSANFPLHYEGTAAILAGLLGDWPAQLAHRRREEALARSAGRTEEADAARTNIVEALQYLGRFDEALAWSSELVARIGNSGSGNAAFAWLGHFAALVDLGRTAEARAVLPRTVAAIRRFDLPYHLDVGAQLLADEGHWPESAALYGYARAWFEGHPKASSPLVTQRLQRLESRLRDDLGDAKLQALAQAGEALNDEALLRLLGLDPAAA